MKAICVFCGSRSGDNPAYVESARAVGRMIAESGHTLVYGGGSVGLMGTVADAALGAGGRVIGVIPRTLWEREVGHRGLSDLIHGTTVDRVRHAVAMPVLLLKAKGGVEAR